MHDHPPANECCPRFEPGPWEDAIHEWREKRFVKGSVFTFLYMPLNFGSVISRMVKKVEGAGASMPDGLCLSDHTSKWNMDLYLAVDREVPGLASATISGRFLSRVYEGDFKQTGQWCKDFDDYAKAHQHEVTKLYMWYTTCPKCAKKFGKNYVAILGRLA